jgi:hypothetical protein
MICLASVRFWNQFVSRHSDRKVPLNDSTKALSVGLPGREKSIFTLFRYGSNQQADDGRFRLVRQLYGFYLGAREYGLGAGEFVVGDGSDEAGGLLAVRFDLYPGLGRKRLN